MIINRNNYEEFFLLYADNELSAQEKNLVEGFVLENSDLEEEFLMVQQSVIKPDVQIRLEDKSFLFKEEQENACQENQTEKLILYNDNELNEKEKTAIEKSPKEDQLLKNEFDLLRRVKLQPETSVIFPNKKLLYKKENGKVIPLTWWRAVAAAILAGFGLWTGITYIQKNRIEIPVEVNVNDKIIESSNKVSVPSVAVLKQPNKVSITAKKNKQNSSSLNQKTEKSFVASSIKKKSTINKFQPNRTVEKPVEQSDKLNDNNVVDVQKKNNDIADILINNSAPASDKIKASDQIISDPQPLNKNAQTVSYVIEQEDDNHVFYNISTEKFNKSKLGGFLKKIKRTIERKSPFHQKDSDKTDVAVN